MWFVYILHCRDNTLYTGITTDITRRLKEHLSGKGRSAKYTRVRTPMKVVYQESFSTRSEALRREAAIKKLSRAQKDVLLQSR